MWMKFCGGIGPRQLCVENDRLQCQSCGGGYVVTSAPAILELKRIDYNLDHAGRLCGDIGPRNVGVEINQL